MLFLVPASTLGLHGAMGVLMVINVAGYAWCGVLLYAIVAVEQRHSPRGGESNTMQPTAQQCKHTPPYQAHATVRTFHPLPRRRQSCGVAGAATLNSIQWFFYSVRCRPRPYSPPAGLLARMPNSTHTKEI